MVWVTHTCSKNVFLVHTKPSLKLFLLPLSCSNRAKPCWNVTRYRSTNLGFEINVKRCLNRPATSNCYQNTIQCFSSRNKFICQSILISFMELSKYENLSTISCNVYQFIDNEIYSQR